MRRVTTAAGAFEARVIAARLGSEGVVWELRGNVDGPFAFGAVEVLVAADDYDTAREILLADEVESSFADCEHASGAPAASAASMRDVWFAVLAIALLALFAVARMAAQG
jgi:hypothetical protein